MGLVVGFGLLAGVGVGCQNKVYDDNVRLREQNRELQARVDERNAAQASTPVTTLAPAEPVRQQPPQPTPPLAHNDPPPSVPIPAGPAPTDSGLGNIEGASVNVTAGQTTVNFIGDALFDPGKATLKESAKTSLTKVAAALKKEYNGKPIKVQGHTDSDPIRHSKWSSNQELSQARADAVRQYLVSKGVDANRVSSEGFGDSKPKDAGTTPTAKAKNRRVEIVVLTH
jgi:flagellar motor protein MotB